jgi:phosphoglycolate phosphatase-like HAD superfamily hydrolase
VALFDDAVLSGADSNVEVVRPVGRRRITHAIHDVDGTHSLIRDWPPVMSLSIHWAMTSGLGQDFDSDQRLAELIARVGSEPLPETDEFCVESAGLSALTQMEYGIRRGVELGNFPGGAFPPLDGAQEKVNADVCRRIWNGEERFDDVEEPEDFRAFVAERSSRLFRLYEKILNGACRDRNTAAAFADPERFRVPGSLEFMQHLFDCGVENYFVTGAVIYADGGMAEEIRAVGLAAGSGGLVRELRGSSWDRKMPKDEVIRALCDEKNIDPAAALVLGDGRTEIAAGAAMGCVAMSRLPLDAARQRELHRRLGTNYILPDWSDPVLTRLIAEE